MMGDEYSIIDMAVWGWARLMPRVIDAAAWDDLHNLKRLVDWITVRPAAKRVIELTERHAFKAEQDEESNRYMFPSNANYTR